MVLFVLERVISPAQPRSECLFLTACSHCFRSHRSKKARPLTTIQLTARSPRYECSFAWHHLPNFLMLVSRIGQRANHHITEIFPLHGCEPLPPIVSCDAPSPSASHSPYHASPFVSRIRWNGGASLAHPPNSGGEQIFRSLAFRPAKLALRDLDRRLQEVEHTLVQGGKITKSSSVRKPGEKKPSTRGRDVVQRRICNILDAGEPTTVDESALIELGIVILETLERMEREQGNWDRCHERAVRQTQLRKQSASEWIVPELADSVQRQLGSSNSDLPSLTELLTLLVHGFALSSQTPMEDFTAQMLRKVMSEVLLKVRRRAIRIMVRWCVGASLNLNPLLSYGYDAGGGGKPSYGASAVS